MRHATQEELVLFYYGELEAVGAHLGECEACRREYQQVQRTLNAVDSLPVPERPEDYGAIVWKRIGPKLAARPRRSWWWTAPKWGLAAGLVVAAFFLGRLAPGPVVSSQAAGAPEKVLMVAVGDHLDRTQMVLAELTNAGDPGKGTLDISYEQRAAEDLVEENRLYRTTASRSGDRATEALLEDLERTLLEIAHSPREVSAARFEELKREIDDRGLLFKVRVYRTRIEEKEKTI